MSQRDLTRFAFAENLRNEKAEFKRFESREAVTCTTDDIASNISISFVQP
jgi:hypothetical protein